MRYHYEKPPIYLSMYGQRYCCDHPVYNHCTLFLVGERGLAVIQQRYDPETKHTFWAEVDEWLTDPLYLHPGFGRSLTAGPGRVRTASTHRDHPADHVGAEDEAPAQATLETVFDHTPI
ncbi:MAG: hypothetical protein ACLRNW_01360 [Neglectibacter sp.]